MHSKQQQCLQDLRICCNQVHMRYELIRFLLTFFESMCFTMVTPRLVSPTEVHRCSLRVESFWNIPIEMKSENNNLRNVNILIYWCGNNITFEKQESCVLNCNIGKNKQLSSSVENNLSKNPKGRDPANKQAMSIAPLFPREN